MTDPTENEEINEELSTDELKSVSGGWTMDQEGSDFADTNPHRDQGHLLKSNDPKGSGYGGTRKDLDKRNNLTQPKMEMPT